MTVAVLIPFYGDAKVAIATVRDVAARARDVGRIALFLVDDGASPPLDAQELASVAGDATLWLARHPVNLGQGAALETARQLALLHGPFDAYVTMDADGQHDPSDLKHLVHAVTQGADIVLGDRFLGQSNVPLVRRSILRAARVFERAMCRIRLRDAHNGYRAMSDRAARALRIRQNRMAHATEITSFVSSAARHQLRWVELPVSIRYTRESRRAGQSSWGAIRIIRDLVNAYMFGRS